MNGVGEQPGSRFAQQQMYVLWHDDKSIDGHLEAAAHSFQNLNKQLVELRRIETRAPVVASEGHEVSLTGLLKPLEASGHEGRL